ncbi:280_t:CDS:2 [Ambispora gerdemannii]|uniref:280_t:CDS:1 n=1 Tax=Ambispora gerdemannii TaxID=144530 RepID=A0A9N9ANT7_9GLOM|nr:280_t:CDS:2 [Ambispora gerdemannii]
MNVSVPLKLSMSVICPWPDIWPWCGTPDCNLICAFFGTRSAYTYDDKYEGIILKTETNESAEESEEKFCYSSQPVVPNSKQQLKQDEIIQDSQKNVSNTKECQLNNHKSTQIPEKVTQPETSKANSQVHPKILQSDTCTTNRERNLKGNHKAAQVSLKVLQSETLKANYEKEVKDIRKSAQNPSKISQPKIFTLKHGNDVKENHFQKIPIEHNSKKDEETTKDTIIIKKDKENFYILDDTTENDIVLHEHDSHHMIAQRTTFPALDNIFARKRIMPLKSFANKEVQAGTGLFETHNLACQTSFSRHVSSVIINPDSHTGDEFVPEAINGMQTERKIIANSNVQTSIVSNKSVGEILNLVNQIKEDSIAKPQETSNTIPELCETNEVGLDDYFKESVADIESEDSSIENDNDENLIERQNEENNEIKEDEFSNREPIVENSSYAISPTGNLENDTSKTQNSNEAIENDQSMVSKHQVIEDNAQEDINVKRLTMVTFAPTANYTSENDNILGDGSVQSIEADLYHGENNEDSIHLMEKWISVALCKQYPNPKDWEYIVDCDLSEKGLESVYSLSNFMPKLETISLNNNNLEYLHGLPSVLTTLKVASNKLTCMTDFRHLPNLQYLDISDNLIEDLNENLDLSENDIEEINGLHSLKTLKSLDLEQNNIRLFNPSQIMNALVCLKIGRNQLVELNVKRMPNLRALVLDHNKLKEIKNSEMLARIATFSARNQKRDDKININFKHIRGVENLYLTGNPLTKLETMTEFFKLDLIELSKVGLKELPEKFYEMCPGVSYINLNYNYLTNIRPLRRLAHLKQLTVICNELSNYEMVLEVTKRLSTLKYCDLRCNPFTMKFYPSLESLLIAYESRRHIWDITETKKYQKEWDIRDKEFRENIPDDIFVKRNIYRFSIIRRCPHMIRLDGSNVEESERIEGEKWYRRLPVELPIIY